MGYWAGLVRVFLALRIVLPHLGRLGGILFSHFVATPCPTMNDVVICKAEGPAPVASASPSNPVSLCRTRIGEILPYKTCIDNPGLPQPDGGTNARLRVSNTPSAGSNRAGRAGEEEQAVRRKTRRRPAKGHVRRARQMTDIPLGSRLLWLPANI